MLGENGLADFHLPRGEPDDWSTQPRLYAVGLLMVDGRDLRPRPQLKRKARLQRSLGQRDSSLLERFHAPDGGCSILCSADTTDRKGVKCGKNW